MNWQQWILIAVITTIVVSIYIRYHNVTAYEEQVRGLLTDMGCPYYSHKIMMECYDGNQPPYVAAHRMRRVWKAMNESRRANNKRMR